MYPYVPFFSRTVTSYALLAAVGLAAGLFVAIALTRHFGRDWQVTTFMYVFGALAGVLGARVLYTITVLPNLIDLAPMFTEDPLGYLQVVLSGGFVFYGGVAGAALGAWLVARYLKVHLADYLPELVTSVPLFHAIGRVGCFMVGCCYGIEADWGVTFEHAIGAPNGVPLVPVQLFESAAELAIFLVLLAYVLSALRPGLSVLGLYLCLYGPARFLLEFWRGDAIRGIWGPFSTSQWISIAILACGLYLLLRKRPAKSDVVGETAQPSTLSWPR